MTETFESIPVGWLIDRDRGELRPLGSSTDPLPHVAVRIHGEAISVVCEPGLQKISAVLAVFSTVLRRSAKERPATQHTADLARVDIENELALLRAMDLIASRPLKRAFREWVARR